MLELRLEAILKRIENVAQEIERIKKLREKVVEDMKTIDAPTNAPALPATDGAMARASTKSLIILPLRAESGAMARALDRIKAKKLA